MAVDVSAGPERRMAESRCLKDDIVFEEHCHHGSRTGLLEPVMVFPGDKDYPLNCVSADRTTLYITLRLSASARKESYGLYCLGLLAFHSKPLA